MALVFGTLVFAALMGVIASAAWVFNRPAPVAPVATQAEGRGIAELTARAWLSNQALPIPAAAAIGSVQKSETAYPVELFAWEGFTTSALPTGLAFEFHYFLFTSPTIDAEGKPVRRTLRITVPIVLTESGPVLGALPSIDAPALATTTAVQFDYGDLKPRDLPAAAREQLERWATHWAADQRDQLKLLTGDQTGGVEYVGLGGFTVSQVRVINALAFEGDEWLVRTRLSLVGANEYRTEMDMDVTIGSGSTGLPQIIGWGPAGIGIVSPEQIRRTL